MHRRVAACVIGLGLGLGTGCGVRAPARIDVLGLLREKGDTEAHQTLVARVLEHPRDVQARLGLARLAEKLGRPSEAIDQLEEVLRLGGPIGVRWHAEDRARLGRLLAARGRARRERGAASALDDLERARTYGAAVTDEDLAYAQLAVATAQLRHVDAGERAKGRAKLLALHAPAQDVRALQAAARPGATTEQRGELGSWLWSIGARRAAFEELDAWHGGTRAPRDPGLEAAYLRALAWWSPVWLGQARSPSSDELAAAGPEKCLFPEGGCPLPGEPAAAPPPAPADRVPPFVVAAAHYALTRFPASTGMPGVERVRDIAWAFRRDPAVAERVARDVVAESTDAAIAHAVVGALFDALGDPKRARSEWQAAVDASPEPAFYRGLAEAAARVGDPDAALVFATAGAAASGDPAATWLAVARAIEGVGRHVEALVAARSAIDLAGPEVLPGALDIAIAASHALGRDQQVEELGQLRARFPQVARDGAATAAVRERVTADTVAQLWVAAQDDPADVEARRVLLDALDREDPRRAEVGAQLARLAGATDDAAALAAVFALRER